MTLHAQHKRQQLKPASEYDLQQFSESWRSVFVGRGGPVERICECKLLASDLKRMARRDEPAQGGGV